MKNKQKILTFLLGFATSLILQVKTVDIEQKEEWIVIDTATTATVYNAVPSQCDDDCLVTASLFKIDPKKIPHLKICAMERTMMKKHGIRYGSYIKISGTGEFDGIWRIEDTMNKRFAGQSRIDLLVEESIKTGKWENVTISLPANRYTMNVCKTKI